MIKILVKKKKVEEDNSFRVKNFGLMNEANPGQPDAPVNNTDGQPATPVNNNGTNGQQAAPVDNNTNGQPDAFDASTYSSEVQTFLGSVATAIQGMCTADKLKAAIPSFEKAKNDANLKPKAEEISKYAAAITQSKTPNEIILNYTNFIKGLSELVPAQSATTDTTQGATGQTQAPAQGA